jgi:hypothetical protein
MRCAEPIRWLGSVDISDLRETLHRQDAGLWDADTAFRQALAPYRQTRTIYLMMTLGGPNAATRYFAGWPPLRESFSTVAARLASFYPVPGRVLNAQIALLPPGAVIPEHRDAGPTLEVTHRVHVPLVTHADVVFSVEDEHLTLAEGQAYELDNMRRHAVENQSPIDRIHLIVDYLEEAPDARG